MKVAVQPSAPSSNHPEDASEDESPPAAAGWWLGALAAGALAACGGGEDVREPATASREGTAAAGEVALQPVYRFAKISNGAYFYTGDPGEKDIVLSHYPDFRYEGVAFQQVTSGAGVPVFRFANLTNGGYFYTASVEERDWVRQHRGDMRYEGSTFAVAAADHPEALPVYRLANLVNQAYLYTTSPEERDAAVGSGLWRAEGVAFHSLPAPATTQRPDTDEAAARFLHHAAFGATDADIAAVRQKGYAAWLNEQIAMPVGTTAWDWLVGQGYTAVNDRTFFFNDGFYQFALWRDLMSAPDAVRRRWALALSELFVISVGSIGGSLNWAGFAGAHFWDTLVRQGLGNFRQLLEAVTLHPAMGAFLNTRGNQKEDPSTGRVPDENYAREVMQLFTIGLYELNMDGTPRLDGQGRPIDTYTQSDVTQLARVFTGYDIDLRGIGTFTSPVSPYYTVWRPEYLLRPMMFDASRYSTLEKRFLGAAIPAGTPGPQALRIALDTLFNHPNVGPFLARQLIQRLVTSHPAPAYVARVAQVFNNNGAGVRGDMAAMLRAIVLDESARSTAGLNALNFGKLREPVLRVANWGRAFKVRSLKGSWKMMVGNWDPESDLQQIPLNAPSVFNFFRPGYVPPSTEMAIQGHTAPEFQLVSESSVSAYLNYLQGILYQGYWVYEPDKAGFPREGIPDNAVYHPDIVPDYAAEFALVGNTPALVRRLNLLLAAGQLSQATQNQIVKALAIDRIPANAPEDFKRIHVARAILFVMASAEYLIQK